MTAGTTSNTTPLPQVGEILNYIFKFAAEPTGRAEGFKERPCMVVDVDDAEREVTLVAFTTKGDRYPDAMPVPQDVAAKANLRHPTAAVVAETNSFTWLGYDLRPLSSTGSITIGRMPPGFTTKLVTAVVDAKNLDRN